MSKRETDRPELAEFTQLIETTMKEKRCTRDRASGIVAKKFPKLHARVVAEANEDNPVAMQHSRFRDPDRAA
jgi:hypothetical protein